jgi:hypothetical protein
MHYSTLLRALRTDRDLKRSGLTTVLAGYNLEEIEEELEYTMMAGWVVENNNGITLSLKWRDLHEDQKRAYLERKDRPQLTDPIDVGMLTGVLIRRNYTWTKLNWHTFKYSLLGKPGADDETPVTLITGLFQGEAWFELAEVKAAIEQAATQWYRTSEGTTAWKYSNHGLNLEQLVNYIEASYHLEPIFQSYGVQNLKITWTISNSNWQETTLLGTRAPEQTVLGSLRIACNTDSSNPFTKEVDSWEQAVEYLDLIKMYTQHFQSQELEHSIEEFVATADGSCWEPVTLSKKNIAKYTSKNLGTNIYTVLHVNDSYIVGAFATLDLAKQAVVYIEYPGEMIDGILVSACLRYQIIALPLVTDVEQDQRELFNTDYPI